MPARARRHTSRAPVVPIALICGVAAVIVLGTLAAAAPVLPGAPESPIASPVASGSFPPAEPLAFPGAVGHGSRTIGGRGGAVVYVSSLSDRGPGSLRAAIELEEPRVILFQVAGTIELQSDIRVEHPYLTVAGQTAPGDGVQVKGGTLDIRTHDVILRYMRFRVGDETTPSPEDTDGLIVNGDQVGAVYNVILDQCSLLWGPDVGGSTFLNGPTRITVQNSIMGEGLRLSRHPEGTRRNGGHSYTTNITDLERGAPWPDQITYYRNLLTTSDSRNPRLVGAANADFINNVVYNWGKRAGYGNPKSLNLIGNYWRSGPETSSESPFYWFPDRSTEEGRLHEGSVYVEDNVSDGIELSAEGPERVYSATPLGTVSAPIVSADEAYDIVIENVGALRPIRDSVDERIIQNLLERTGEFVNGVGERSPNPDWSTLRPGPLPTDTDADGMDDMWERTSFATLVRTGKQDHDGDGYTDLEEFLAEAAAGAARPMETTSPVPS